MSKVMYGTDEEVRAMSPAELFEDFYNYAIPDLKKDLEEREIVIEDEYLRVMVFAIFKAGMGVGVTCDEKDVFSFLKGEYLS